MNRCTSADALVGPLAQGVQLVADQRDEPGDDRHQQQHGPDEHGQHRRQVRPAAGLQPAHQRDQQGGQEQGHDHRHDDDLEQDEQVEHEPGGGQHDQQAPAPGGQLPQHRGHVRPGRPARSSVRSPGRSWAPLRRAGRRRRHTRSLAVGLRTARSPAMDRLGMRRPPVPARLPDAPDRAGRPDARRHYGAGQGRAGGRGAGHVRRGLQAADRGGQPGRGRARRGAAGGPAHLRVEPGHAAGGAGPGAAQGRGRPVRRGRPARRGRAPLPAGRRPGRLPGRPLRAAARPASWPPTCWSGPGSWSCRSPSAWPWPGCWRRWAATPTPRTPCSS